MTASGSDGGVDVRFVRSLPNSALPLHQQQEQEQLPTIDVDSVRIGGASGTTLGSTMCLAITDTILVSGHSSNIVRAINFG